MRRQIVEHHTWVLGERDRLSLSGLTKLSDSSLRNWLSDLHVSKEQVKISDDEIVVDVKGEYQFLKLMAPNGCALGSAAGAKVRVKLMTKPKHLDTEEVVAKVK